MGPLHVFVFACFRENVTDTCKIVSFLCSLDNFLLKNVNGFFWKSNFKMALIWKKAGLFLTYFSHFSVIREKAQKIPSAHISLTYIQVFCSLYWLFVLPILQNLRILSCMVSLWGLLQVLILIRAILEQSINNQVRLTITHSKIKKAEIYCRMSVNIFFFFKGFTPKRNHCDSFVSTFQGSIR